MSPSQQIKVIDELSKIILKGNPHIKMEKVRVGVVNNCYTQFKGSGNVYKGFKNIAVSIMNENIILKMDLDPSIHWDCFRPNPSLSVFQVVNIEEAKDIVRQMLEFSTNLKSGFGQLTLK